MMIMVITMTMKITMVVNKHPLTCHVPGALVTMCQHELWWMHVSLDGTVSMPRRMLWGSNALATMVHGNDGIAVQVCVLHVMAGCLSVHTNACFEWLFRTLVYLLSLLVSW